MEDTTAGNFAPLNAHATLEALTRLAVYSRDALGMTEAGAIVVEMHHYCARHALAVPLQLQCAIAAFVTGELRAAA